MHQSLSKVSSRLVGTGPYRRFPSQPLAPPRHSRWPPASSIITVVTWIDAVGDEMGACEVGYFI